MDRRAFIGSLAGGLLAAPLAAEAQPAGLTTFFLWNSITLSPPLPAPDVTVAGYGASTDLPVVGLWGP